MLARVRTMSQAGFWQRHRTGAAVGLDEVRLGCEARVVGIQDHRLARAALLVGLVDGMVVTVRDRGHGHATTIEHDGQTVHVPALLARRLRCEELG